MGSSDILHNLLCLPRRKRRTEPTTVDMKLASRLPEDAELYRVQTILFPPDQDAGITDEELASVLPECVNLEIVQFSGLPDISDRTLSILAVTANQLRGIDLSGLQFITNAGLQQLAAQCLKLEWIKLSNVAGLTDAAVSALAVSCPKLSELELDSCNLLTALSVRDIWTFTRRLKRLKLSKCSQLNDKAFPSRASPNSSYSLRQPTSVDDKWLENLPPLTLPPSYSHENLRALDLTQCSKLTDEAIAGIVKYAPKIQTFILSGCSQLTDGAIESICNLGVHLDVLGLSYVSKITDPAIVKLGRACSRLRSVDLAFCSNLTDMAVLELAGLPHLRRLSLVGLRKITDNAVFFIAEHTATMERLHLSYCEAISLDAVHLVTKKLARLQHFTVTGIPALSRPGVARFSERPPADNSDSGTFRVFIGGNIKALCKFLDKELDRKREAEMRNILFVPRSDDELDLY